MAERGIILEKVELVENTNSSLAGKIFVLTGTLQSMTRDEAKEKIRIFGGKEASSVSGKTDFVIAGEEAGSKKEKAEELGMRILSEEEFLNFLK